MEAVDSSCQIRGKLWVTHFKCGDWGRERPLVSYTIYRETGWYTYRPNI